MLQFHKDVISRLVLSAQKRRSLNKPFKVVHANTWNKYPVIVEDTSSVATEDEVELSKIPQLNASISNSEKIDEKVDKIINNPHILEIKAELEFAEALLNKVRSIDENNPKIPAIQETVIRLKLLLEQKNYV